MNTITKTEQRRIEIAERKAAREAAKAAKVQALQSALSAAETALAPPPSLGSWGVVKTRCWSAVHGKLRHQTQLKRKSTAALAQLAGLMRELPDWDADRCATVMQELTGGAA